jgi:hypothetical protein
MGSPKKLSEKKSISKIFNYKSPDEDYIEKGVF